MRATPPAAVRNSSASTQSASHGTLRPGTGKSAYVDDGIEFLLDHPARHGAGSLVLGAATLAMQG